ncbi:Chaperone protein DnaK [Labilithrix luteola]|uniref:Chaperone protein DnaK n=1 Tax=Labilithrix luteola TaxID=1391654 RepID=A0A0K1PRS3_9BACT|nr:toll/interleukin-1 receptor domain-containing protein [Labilithrix luteola]AKU95824.1 Chaperone protein DnaK [Labilithrix luteola]
MAWRYGIARWAPEYPHFESGALISTTPFSSYSDKDQEYRDKLEEHLAGLERQGLIEAWSDRKILPGDAFGDVISAELERASIVLLLVSSAFIASDYCFSIEMARALERHTAKSARVIPIILRPCDWKPMPFGHLKAVPHDGKAVALWPDTDEALLDVALGIRQAVMDEKPEPEVHRMTPRRLPPVPGSATMEEAVRSSNLRITKEFTELDKEKFLAESFEYIASYFKNSLDELQSRESSVDVKFERIDTRTFAAAIYRNGGAQSRCEISLVLDGHLGHGIRYASGGTRGGFNESLQAEADEHILYLKSFGMMDFARRDEKLTKRAGADLYWNKFLEPLQQRR